MSADASMPASEVARVIDAFAQEGITVWVEGGWGVDALLGRVTREHSDLDLALDGRNLTAACQLLEKLGYAAVPGAEPGLPARILLAGADGAVDLHPLSFDAHGNGWLQLSDTARSWSCQWREALQATGTVAGRRVACISARLQMELHMRYEWRDVDLHDVRMLAEELGLPLPPGATWHTPGPGPAE